MQLTMSPNENPPISREVYGSIVPELGRVGADIYLKDKVKT